MIQQLLVGSAIISLTIIVQAIFLGVAATALDRVGGWLVARPQGLKYVATLICVTLWLLVAHAVNVWIWAGALMGVGAFDALEPALYFSVVAFTTLGFGDITLPVEWRLLSGLAAANGLLLFGLSTAFLVEFLSQFGRAVAEAKAARTSQPHKA